MDFLFSWLLILMVLSTCAGCSASPEAMYGQSISAAMAQLNPTSFLTEV